MSKLISFVNSGNYAIVDDEDYEWLSCLDWQEGKDGYAYSYVNKKIISMHRLLMDPPSDLQVDHINRNRLDNQRHNLRIVTQAVNMQNRNPFKASTYPEENIPLIQAINEAFDRTKADLGFSTDKELARFFEVSTKTLSFLRNGQLTRVTEFIARALIGVDYPQ
jgi:hypothetical protein